MGVGHGMVLLATLLLILQLTPRERFGRRANVLEAMAVGSNMLHVFLGGMIAAWFGWRAALLWPLGGALVAAALLWRHQRLGPPTVPGDGNPVGWMGSANGGVAVWAIGLIVTITVTMVSPGRRSSIRSYRSMEASGWGSLRARSARCLPPRT